MNCIIVDDEYPAIEELKYFITNFSSIKIHGEFDDAIKALDYIQKQAIDIIFLDISMPKLDGIALGRVVKGMVRKPKIIFITAYAEYAIEAFEVEAFDYILKPYSEERIISTLKKLEKSSYTNIKSSSRITLWKKDKMFVINIDDIYYCEADERETIVYTKDDKFIVSSSISEFHKKLSQINFFRSHRSFIINIDKVKEIIPWFNNTYMVKLEQLDIEIPVSRSNINEFKHLMGI